LRHKTGRVDRDEHDGGLTSGVGRRQRPDVAVNCGGLVWARLQKDGGARGAGGPAARGGGLGRGARPQALPL
jgi:hypothetical protein